MNLEKEFLPYEQALELKELGFDEPCFGDWNYNNGEINYWYDEEIQNERTNKWFLNLEEQFPKMNKNGCTAPTFSQAFRWFRENHNWQNSIDPTADQHSRQLGYNYWIWNYKTGEEYHTMPKNRPAGDWEYKTYEEAELACLNKLIEITKTK